VCPSFVRKALSKPEGRRAATDHISVLALRHAC
jgi:hypothetical protein